MRAGRLTRSSHSVRATVRCLEILITVLSELYGQGTDVRVTNSVTFPGTQFHALNVMLIH